MPINPPPSPWRIALGGVSPQDDLVGVGADLEPGTLLAAYRAGLFPMGIGEGGGGPMGWWSPDPRGVLLPGALHVSRSLRRHLPRFGIRVDTAFEQVVAACADPARDSGWITEEMRAAYTRLHRLGWAHSVEAWAGGELVGGLYGVAIGGLFAAESMFHRRTDAGKAAVCGLVRLMGGAPWVIDVQWRTEHLATLGVGEVPRAAYLQGLPELLARDLPDAFASPRSVQRPTS